MIELQYGAAGGTDAVMAPITITCAFCGITYDSRPDPYTHGCTCPHCLATAYWYFHNGTEAQRLSSQRVHTTGADGE